MMQLSHYGEPSGKRDVLCLVGFGLLTLVLGSGSHALFAAVIASFDRLDEQRAQTHLLEQLVAQGSRPVPAPAPTTTRPTITPPAPRPADPSPAELARLAQQQEAEAEARFRRGG
jgi:hypothetical protein